jgi:hypothetical protein
VVAANVFNELFMDTLSRVGPWRSGRPRTFSATRPTARANSRGARASRARVDSSRSSAIRSRASDCPSSRPAARRCLPNFPGFGTAEGHFVLDADEATRSERKLSEDAGTRRTAPRFRLCLGAGRDGKSTGDASED